MTLSVTFFFFLTETHFSKEVALICLYFSLENLSWPWAYYHSGKNESKEFFLSVVVDDTGTMTDLCLFQLHGEFG